MDQQEPPVIQYMQVVKPPKSGLQHLAGLLGGLIILAIGVLLLCNAPIVGIVYFGVLVLIALARFVSR